MWGCDDQVILARPQRSFRSEKATMQRMRDRNKIRFPAQGDGRAVRDRRQELLRHVVYNVLLDIVPSEDAAEEVAQLALVVDRDAVVERRA